MFRIMKDFTAFWAGEIIEHCTELNGKQNVKKAAVGRDVYVKPKNESQLV